MGDINIKQVERLRFQIRIVENLTLIGTIGIALAVYNQADDWTFWLVFALVLLFILKYTMSVRLRKKEFLSKIVEQRTMELRFQRDQIQAESHKLERALTALGEAQDELVRKERLASIGQLTQGLVDRILNPLNYINNFAGLSASLAKDIQENMVEDQKNGNFDNFNDSAELLVLLQSNLDKIGKHGISTVRIVKAMEELLKDRSANRTIVEVNELCKINLDIFQKNYAKEIAANQIAISYSGLSTSLTVEMNIDQMGKALQHILNNSIYALIKKRGISDFSPEITLSLRIRGDKLQIIIRDNGMGIEEGIRNKVFSPFFTTKPTGEAAGTGLYLSREVILNHKGTIEMTSEKNEFTEVTISLPIYQ